MIAICKFNLLSRNLSTSSLVILGISEVALTIFIILQWHTNRKSFFLLLLPHKLFTYCFWKCKSVLYSTSRKFYFQLDWELFMHFRSIFSLLRNPSDMVIQITIFELL